MAEFSLWLRENPAISDVDIRNVTTEFMTWRHSIKSVLGCGPGDGQYIDVFTMRINYFNPYSLISQVFDDLPS